MTPDTDNAQPLPMNGRPPWKLPQHLEPWREFIVGNGEPLEVTMRGVARIQINAPLALIQQGIRAQVNVLDRLYQENLLATPLLPDTPAVPLPPEQMPRFNVDPRQASPMPELPAAAMGSTHLAPPEEKDVV